MTRPFLLGPDPSSPFPPAELALDDPDGLLCLGGDLHPSRLLRAYAGGIFPWFNDGQPILWWSPSERMVFRSDGVHLSRRFQRTMRTLDWTIRFDDDFDAVVAACADTPRRGESGTWITAAMRRAYGELHDRGHAQAVAVRDASGRLVGGLYGVALGRAFFAESMVSLASGGSKVALAALGWRLRQWGWPWFDAQLENPHLVRMGGEVWPRTRFLGTFRPLAAPGDACPAWGKATVGLDQLLAGSGTDA